MLDFYPRFFAIMIKNAEEKEVKIVKISLEIHESKNREDGKEIVTYSGHCKFSGRKSSIVCNGGGAGEKKVEVSLKESKLVLSIKGQPIYFVCEIRKGRCYYSGSGHSAIEGHSKGKYVERWTFGAFIM